MSETISDKYHQLPHPPIHHLTTLRLDHSSITLPFRPHTAALLVEVASGLGALVDLPLELGHGSNHHGGGGKDALRSEVTEICRTVLPKATKCWPIRAALLRSSRRLAADPRADIRHAAASLLGAYPPPPTQAVDPSCGGDTAMLIRLAADEHAHRAHAHASAQTSGGAQFHGIRLPAAWHPTSSSFGLDFSDAMDISATLTGSTLRLTLEYRLDLPSSASGAGASGSSSSSHGHGHAPPPFQVSVSSPTTTPTPTDSAQHQPPRRHVLRKTRPTE